MLVVVDIIINQKIEDVICVYVVVGQKVFLVVFVVIILEEKGVLDYIIIVVVNVDEFVMFQYIVLYIGVVLVEYFMYKGKVIVIVYDDFIK